MISAVIITKNEEYNIEDCLLSLKGVVQEVIVVDSYSTDRTRDICLKHDVKFHSRNFLNYSDQKNYGIGMAQFEFILSIDADERLSEELRQNIIKLSTNKFKHDLYTVARKTNYCGKWINYSGWYPDIKHRIWKKGIAKWEGAIHERLMYNTINIGHINGDLLHYSFNSFNDHINRINHYTDKMAEEIYLTNRGKNINIFHLLFKPLYKALHRYFFKLGFLDGYYGLVICILSGYYTFFKYSKALDLMKRNKTTLET